MGVFAAAAAGLVLLSGCGSTSSRGGDLVAGKQAFVAKCGACHTLSRANTKGTVGPNLDAAFARSQQDGFDRSVVQGIVERQIMYPRKGGVMPAKLVDGDRAHDIAAYVASVVAKPGKDTGLLAKAVGGKQQALAKEQDGELSIPANPDGQLLYTYKNAVATAGEVTIESKNASSIDHDIAIEGNGVPLTKGSTGKDGHVSKLTVDLKPGTYTFFCTLPGHAAAGMKGTLTVK